MTCWVLSKLGPKPNTTISLIERSL